MSQIDLAIIIVNYNVAPLLKRCLQTICAGTGHLNLQTIVIDNQSTDNSVNIVKTEFPHVTIIANSKNVGYPAGNNQGIRALDILGDNPPRYTLLLNPDTELPPNALPDMVQFMDDHPTVGIVGPKLLLPDGQLDPACRRGFPSPAVSIYHFTGLSRLFPKSARFGRYNMSYLDPNQMAEVDSVVGAFMLIRTTAIRQVGLLDERFWMYGEDLDWAKRIKDSGWQVIYNPSVTVLHVKRASSRQNHKKAQYEFYRAMPIFYYKHYRRQTPFWLHLLVILGIAIVGGPTIWSDLLSGYRILRQPTPVTTLPSEKPLPFVR